MQEMLKKGQFEQIVASEISSFEDSIYRATALTRLGRLEEAEQELAKHDEPNAEQEIDLLLARLDILQTAGKHREIIEHFGTFTLPEKVSEEKMLKLFQRRGESLQLFDSHERALEDLSAAHELAKGLDDTAAEFYAIDAGIESARAVQNFVLAEQMERLSLESSKELSATSEDPALLFRVAESVSLLGDEDVAEEIFEKAEKIAREREFDWVLGQVLLARSRFDEFSVDTISALSRTLKAIEVFSKLNAKPMVMMANDQYAAQLLNSGDTDRALEALDVVCKESKQFGDIHMYLNTLAKMTNVLFDAGQNRLALDKIAEIIETCAEKDIRPGFIEILMREAYRRCSPDLIEQKLGNYMVEDDEDEESYDL